METNLFHCFFLFYVIKKKSRVLKNTSNCINFICLSSLLEHSEGRKSLKLLITVIVAKRYLTEDIATVPSSSRVSVCLTLLFDFPPWLQICMTRTHCCSDNSVVRSLCYRTSLIWCQGGNSKSSVKQTDTLLELGTVAISSVK